jgi:hypothetical protein
LFMTLKKYVLRTARDALAAKPETVGYLLQ